MACFLSYVACSRRITTTQLKWQTVFFILCVYGMDVVFSQARYSIPEEMPEASFVGNIAKDLGIEISRLVSGKARVVTKGGRQYVELSRDKGTLVVKERIDREELCKQTTPCSFSFDLIMENPIELHRVTVEVLDINDNAPVFLKDVVSLEISENAATETRFPLDSAVDMDVGINGIQNYALSSTDNFKLEINSQDDGRKYIEMILQRELDREERDELKLVLTAYDGGSPKKSGTARIQITVLDTNDNAPVCKQSVYKVDVSENSPVGTLLTTLSATDADEGINGQISYTIVQASKEARELFKINPETGDITTLNTLDYESETSHQLNVKARDKWGLADTCKVIVEVIDENDNSPSIQLMSFSNIISENSPIGTTVAVINVEDADSGKNGLVQCKINENTPFKIESSLSDYYAIITDETLDRENMAEYNITILVSDQGSPARHNNKTINVKISDVNDNPPVFSSDEYKTVVIENNSPGVAVLTVKASDADWGPNARLSYFLDDNNIQGNPVSSFVSVNSDSGVIHAVKAFDYEQMKTFSFNVTARDGGSPPLSSEVTVTIIVQDQNDNAPQVLYPVQTGGSVLAEIVPRSADVGYLVTKVVAVDVDSGQNAWLSYKLHKATDRALFEVGAQNGEIRTVRQVTDKDAVKQKLTVLVEDNGQPSRSAVVNINVAVADTFPEVLSEFTDFTHNKQYNDDLTFYLVLALAAVSLLFITTVVVIISVKIYRWRQSRIFYQSNLPVIPYYPPGYADTGVTGTLPHMYNYDACMTTDSRKCDSKFSTLRAQNVLLVDPTFTETVQRAMNRKNSLEDPDSPESQKPPNNDWRLPPNQRPGPSGQHRFHTLQQRWTPYEKSRAGVRPEEAGAGAVVGTGPWPNPPTEAEQLQALMAAANEVSEATATLGPRYNAQYVPDYRQNVYIPGSTATLTANPQQQMPQQALPPPQAPPQAAPSADVPKAAPTPASKKKVTKKDKK
ncbi:protocadherin beta-16-like isoform X5 [Pangasianodon hypophthalmus]|uniref:protocadherin beta-16-like isoform X5 n=1 Tax=Pangasianodon hypophthalmus TaxID=310915 RepID=UPI002307146D|nr:protocadherin beta-16-like isoform X5 [Pangasianodon hypophthalmus]